MNAISSRKKLTALLAVLMAVFVMVSMMCMTVVTASAEEGDATDVTEEVTVAETGDESEAEEGTEADSSAETTGETQTEAVTNASSGTTGKVDHTTGIVNLVVGGVILVALVVLASVFRAKIPVWFKAIRSECGKIVWCPKDKLKKNSIVVVVIILILTVLVGLLDLAFSEGIVLLGNLF